jgi:hypothetical protein
MIRRAFVSLVPLFLLFAFVAAASPARAVLWEASHGDLIYVEIEKSFEPQPSDVGTVNAGDGEATANPLPQEVLDILHGSDWVDYPAMVGAYVRLSSVPDLEEALQTAGLAYSEGLPREIQLPQHEIEPGDPSTRVAPGFPESFSAEPIASRFVVQFAYPVKEAWLGQLEACSVKVVAAFAQRAFLVIAANEEAITNCDVLPYLDWIDPYLTTDRVSPELLAETSAGFSLQFTSGANLTQKGVTLGSTMTLGAIEDGGAEDTGFVEVTASGEALANFAQTDPDLLSVTYAGTADWSDERVGLIVAGRGGTAGTLAATGYVPWLASRGLGTAANQQVVAIFDSGYDRGVPPNPGVLDPNVIDHHPDLEAPDRLVLLKGVPDPNVIKDKLGHGTMVAGIVSGQANPITLSGGLHGGGADSLGYAYGTGVAPQSRLAVVPIPAADISRSDRQNVAFQTVLAASVAADRATICNQSWNLSATGAGIPAPNPVNTYDAMARFMDERVLDANAATTTVKEPMAVVFSAGNYAYQYPNGPARFNTVASPATGKNVIAVGATTNWRPSSAAGEPPVPCAYTMALRPPDQDATRADVLGLFSGRGRFFGGAGTSTTANRVRIKPDLVAPGVRIFSTVPFGLEGVTSYISPVGCTKYFPSNADTGYYYTYGSGTSFAAPVVSGVAALLRKWFLDNQQNNPSPALLKAAMVATADDLGHVSGQDHRPSPMYGWGRVDLDRLTDPAVQRFWNDNPTGIVTGEMRQWTRTIGTATKDVYIAIAWADPPAVVASGPAGQGTLVNDLNLSVEELDSRGLVLGTWYGNLFRENVNGTDTGFSWKFTTPLGAADPRDAINNVEGVFIPANALPAGRKLRIKVMGQTVTSGPQRFAVYAYNLQPGS